MESTAGGPPKRRVPSWLVPVVGYAVSIGCLIWVYHGFNWHEQIPRLLATDWRYVTIAVVADVCVYVIQGWRWTLVLRPLERVSLRHSVQAVYIGLFANEVLPLRSGEVIRCYLLSKWYAIPLTVTISSAVIERLLDGIWLSLGFWVVTHFIPLPGYLVGGARVLAVALAVTGALLVFAVIHKKHAHAAVRKSRWAAALRNIIDGSHDMGRSMSFLAASVVSLLYFLVQVVPVYALAKGYGLDISFTAAAVVLVILRLGSIPPQAPSNVGAFQFFTIVALELVGTGRSEATGFATLLFVVMTAPLWLGGFIALLATRMRLTDIHQRARNHFSNGTSPGKGER